MKRVTQGLDELVESLSPLESQWEDATATKAIATLRSLPAKAKYTPDDVASLLQGDFTVGLLICRLFLGLSDDELQTHLTSALGPGTGIKRFTNDRAAYIDALESAGLLSAMREAVNHQPVWSDVLVERLRCSRGKAIRGQQRGRNLEEFGEKIVKSIFATYEMRCKFTGANGESAKCDFAIPNRQEARILIEAKGYGATGSKMSDIIGDLNIIIAHKRHDTSLLFLTDGVTWARRIADLRRIVDMQNRGEITRIYTTKMQHDLAADLRQLKIEHGLT